MSKILMAVTAADSLTLADGTAHPTGFWAEELVVAHRELTRAGHDVLIATPGGRPAPVDPGSLNADVVGDATLVEEFRAYLETIRADLEAPAALGDIVATDFAAVVLPGGHGPMADLAFDEDLGRLLVAADAAQLLIAPFCHGPAGLLSATAPDGRFAFGSHPHGLHRRGGDHRRARREHPVVRGDDAARPRCDRGGRRPLELARRAGRQPHQRPEPAVQPRGRTDAARGAERLSPSRGSRETPLLA